jgi:hypothetical protein
VELDRKIRKRFDRRKEKERKEKKIMFFKIKMGG